MNVAINAEKVTRHQKAHCMTRADFSRASGISICTVKKLGAGRYMAVSVKTLRRMADTLSFDPDTVIATTEEMEAYTRELRNQMQTEQDARAQEACRRKLDLTVRIMQPQHA